MRYEENAVAFIACFAIMILIMAAWQFLTDVLIGYGMADNTAFWIALGISLFIGSVITVFTAQITTINNQD